MNKKIISVAMAFVMCVTSLQVLFGSSVIAEASNSAETISATGETLIEAENHLDVVTITGEAETAATATVKTDLAGYSGAGYLRINDTKVDAIRWDLPVNIVKADKYFIDFSVVQSHPYHSAITMYIDGEKLGQSSQIGASAGKALELKSYEKVLTAGAHTITVKAEKYWNENKDLIVDYIKFTPETITVSEAGAKIEAENHLDVVKITGGVETPATATVKTDLAGYSGEGYLRLNDTQVDAIRWDLPVNVSVAGKYKLDFHVVQSHPYHSLITMYVDGEKLGQSSQIGTTAEKQLELKSYEKALTAGAHTITVQAAKNWNTNKDLIVDYVQFSFIETVVFAESIALNKTETALLVGKTETLLATVLPENTTNKAVVWSSSDESVATVSNGVVTAVSKGEAVITATTDNKLAATCTVTVNEPDPEAFVSNITPYGDFSEEKDVLQNTTVQFSTAAWESDGSVKLSSIRHWKYTLFTPIPVVPDETYTITFKARREDDGYDDVSTLALYINYASGNSYEGVYERPQDRELTTTWKTFTFKYTPTDKITSGVPRTDEFFQLGFKRGSEIQSQDRYFYIDDLTVTPSCTNGYDWQGYVDQICGINRDPFDKDDGFVPEKTSEAAYKTFYVDADNGNDSNGGTESAPFKTIKHAKETVQEHLASMSGHIYVYIKGNHNLTETLTWTTADSGQNGYNVIYTSWGETQPEITMKKDFSGFTKYDEEKNIYRTYVGDVYSRQVYIDGVRAVRAKTDDNKLARKALTNATRSATSEGLYYVSYDTEMADFKNQSEIEFVYSEQWTNPRIRVGSIVKINDNRVRITMDKESWLPHYNSTNTTTIGQYPTWIENAYELLDTPGEFYINKSDGYLYYMPRSFENPETMTATLPVGEQAFVVAGDSTENKIHNIEFKNLAFKYTTWNYPNEIGLRDGQAMFLDSVYTGNARTKGKIADAAVTVLDAAYVDFKECTFAHLGGTGLLYSEVFQKCEVLGNNVYDISSSGIVMGHNEYQEENYLKYYLPSKYKDYMIGNHIKNNTIHDVGVEYMSAPGMVISLLINSYIKHNEIYNVNYTGMHVGWGWKQYDYGRISSYVGNEIMYNYIHDTCQSHLYDGANIYMLGHTGGKNILANNYLENQRNGHGAIYFDEGSDNWHAYNNVIDLKEVPTWKNGTASSVASTWIHNGPFSSKEESRDGQVYNNYSTTSSVKGTITTTAGVYEQAIVSADANWDSTAQSIMDNAGLDSTYLAKNPDRVQRLRVMNEAKDLYELELGETMQMDVSAYTRKLNTTSADISYYSSDESVATVDKNGLISTCGRGNTTIYAECLSDGVIVRQFINLTTGKKAEQIKTDLSVVAVTVGDTAELSATAVFPDGKKLKISPTVTFDDDSVATVTDGVLTGIKAGKTVMHATFAIDDIVHEIDVDVYVTNHNDGTSYTPTKVSYGNSFLKAENWTGKATSSGTSATLKGTSHNFAPSYYKNTVDGFLKFRAKINNSINWPAFVVGAESMEKNYQTGNCYVIAVKSKGIELWRFNNGERTVIFGSDEYVRYGGDAYTGKTLSDLKSYKNVVVGAKQETDGTRIVFEIDGTTVFNYLDTDVNRAKGNYLGVYEWTGDFSVSYAY